MSTESPSAKRAVSVLDFAEMKRRREPIAVLTAYDFLFARLVDDAGVDAVLVGDSLGQVVLGLPTTLAVTLEEMIHHARAVRRGVRRALLVVDLPFGTYQVNADEAVRHASRVLKETGAAAVKLEGGDDYAAATVQRLVRAGIPVMAHLGFTPQSVNTLGGSRVQGRGEALADILAADAQRLQAAGAFSLVLELVPGPLADRVTAALTIPTIGIGAGAGCDGQVLVLHDMLGLNRDFRPKFLRRFAELGDATEAAVREFREAVKTRSYPASEHTFG